jgi:hypothetical protein
VIFVGECEVVDTLADNYRLLPAPSRAVSPCKAGSAVVGINDSHSRKGSVRYRYYVSLPLLYGKSEESAGTLQLYNGPAAPMTGSGQKL